MITFFYLSFEWDGILEWPYVGFSANSAIFKPSLGFNGNFIIDATTGIGKLFHFNDGYDLKFNMDMAMIHVPIKSFKSNEKAKLRMYICKMNDYLHSGGLCFEKPFVRWSQELSDVLNQKRVLSYFLKAYGRILYFVVFKESGIYLYRWNFWS